MLLRNWKFKDDTCIHVYSGKNHSGSKVTDAITNQNTYFKTISDQFKVEYFIAR